MHGPGKYNDLVTMLRTELPAKGVVLFVIDGPDGTGVSTQVDPTVMPAMVGVLRKMADEIEEQHKQGQN